MRGLHIVRVDLQLGLRTHLGSLGKKQISIRLMRLGLLRILCDLQVSDKPSAGIIIEDKFDKLVRRTTSYGMKHMRLSCHMLFTMQKSKGINLRLAAFAELLNEDFIGDFGIPVSRYPGIVYDHDFHLRTRLLIDMQVKPGFVDKNALEAFMNMDKIMVMDNGKCIGIGTHSELMENCAAYRETFEMQTS